MRLVRLEDDEHGTLRFQCDHEPGDHGDIYEAIRQQIPRGERCQDLDNVWHIKATHANIQILGTLIPDFTARLGALRAQLPLF